MHVAKGASLSTQVNAATAKKRSFGRFDGQMLLF
jgi:hypothetical protein